MATDNMQGSKKKMHGSFSYLEVDRPGGGDPVFVDDNARARFKTIAIGVARIYFVDVDDVELQVLPEHVQLYRDDTEHEVAPLGAGFIISWDHDYIMFVAGTVHLHLFKQKQHAIDLRGPALASHNEVVAQRKAARAPRLLAKARELVAAADREAAAVTDREAAVDREAAAAATEVAAVAATATALEAFDLVREDYLHATRSDELI